MLWHKKTSSQPSKSGYQWVETRFEVNQELLTKVVTDVIQQTLGPKLEQVSRDLKNQITAEVSDQVYGLVTSTMKTQYQDVHQDLAHLVKRAVEKELDRRSWWLGFQRKVLGWFRG